MIVVKQLTMEFQALFELKNDIKNMIRSTEENRRKQTECSNEISKVKLSESDLIKTSMFGAKVSKEERLKELEESLKQVSARN